MGERLGNPRRKPVEENMRNVILQRGKDPLGAMMLDYLHGVYEAEVEVESSTLEMSTMSGEVMFREHERMDELERQGLALCTGPLLDVGGGSGCHSLWLQRRMEVDTLDISPGCIEVMRERGVRNPLLRNFFAHEGRRYNTILMLMNGVGICGDIDGIHRLLVQARTLLAPGGQILADSTDLAPLCKGAPKRWHAGWYLGETEFVMKYKEIVSDPFPWLYIDFHTMQAMAEFNGLHCRRLAAYADGRYLMRLWPAGGLEESAGLSCSAAPQADNSASGTPNRRR